MKEWRNVDEEILMSEELNKEDILAAKFEEMDKWNTFETYDEVENCTHQKLLFYF